MKQKFLLLRLCLLMLFAGAMHQQSYSQTTDATGMFDPILTGTETVYAAVVFNDVDKDGVFDAIFTMSDRAIGAWADYASVVAFYHTGLTVRIATPSPGGSIVAAANLTNVIVPVPGEVVHLWISLDVPNKKYYVHAQTGSMAQPLPIYEPGGDFRFQATTLDRWSAVHNSGGEPDFLTVQHVATDLAIGTLPASIGDPALKSLSTSIGTLEPAFDPDVTEYSVTLPFGTTSVNINAVPRGVGATVSGAGNFVIDSDYVFALIMVTAGNGDVAEYAIEFVMGDGVKDASLMSLSGSVGKMVPAFDRNVTEYTLFVPSQTASVDILAQPTFAGASVTGAGSVNIEGGVASTTVKVVSNDGSAEINYKVNVVVDNMYGWDGNGAVGDGSQPSMFGWAGTTVTEWQVANNAGGGIRYWDATSGWTSNGAPWTGRVLYSRWDGVGGATVANVYSFPVVLEACKSYLFVGKYGWVNNGTSPTYTVGINSAADNTGEQVASNTFFVANRGNVLHDMAFGFTPPQSGTYYLTVTCNNGVLGAIGAMSIIENKEKSLLVSVGSLKLSYLNKSVTFRVSGNLLTEGITISAPSSITLDKTVISAEEANCGVTVTATYNDASNDIAGDITFASGELSYTLPFTYEGRSVSIYEKDVLIESNGKAYTLEVKSVNNSIDELTVLASEGFAVSATNFTALDFEIGMGAVPVLITSSAPVGTTGTITFSTEGKVLKTVSVSVVAPFERFYIVQNSSKLVIGLNSNGNYPGLKVDDNSISTQFFFRPVSAGVYQIVRDEDYMMMRKDAANAYNTNFGYASAEANWSIDFSRAGFVTLVNGVTKKLLGSDAIDVDSRLFGDKSYVEGGNTEWILRSVNALPVSADLSHLSLNVGELKQSFDAQVVTYEAVLPVGTTLVTPVAVPVDFGAQVTGLEAVDVTSGSGVSTITVISSDGLVQKVYTINYTIATKVKTVRDASIVVYPTVSKGSFTVKADSQIKAITVFDLSGKVIAQMVGAGASETIEVAKAGMYIMKIDAANGSQMVKVIVTQ
jgi:hypothetical protein